MGFKIRFKVQTITKYFIRFQNEATKITDPFDLWLQTRSLFHLILVGDRASSVTVKGTTLRQKRNYNLELRNFEWYLICIRAPVAKQREMESFVFYLNVNPSHVVRLSRAEPQP